jgi:hypothetical protein
VYKSRDGIYSYFIRGFNNRVEPKTINELKQYAVKVVESRDSMLIVGKNWVAVIKKIYDSEHERIQIRCFNDICEPYNEIIPKYLEYVEGVIEDVEVDCNELRIIDRDKADHTCFIRYNYYNYSMIIAITIDPLDINKLNNDRELQILLDLMPSNTILVRPM